MLFFFFIAFVENVLFVKGTIPQHSESVVLMKQQVLPLILPSDSFYLCVCLLEVKIAIFTCRANEMSYLPSVICILFLILALSSVGLF